MSDADQLYEAIKHGDDEHRAWLRTACTNFFAGESVPPPTGQGRAEAAEAKSDRLQARVEELEKGLASTAEGFLAGVKQNRELHEHLRGMWPYKDLIEAGQDAAEDMRERAATEADRFGDPEIRDAIRDLPLEEKDGE